MDMSFEKFFAGVEEVVRRLPEGDACLAVSPGADLAIWCSWTLAVHGQAVGDYRIGVLGGEPPQQQLQTRRAHRPSPAVNALVITDCVLAMCAFAIANASSRSPVSIAVTRYLCSWRVRSGMTSLVTACHILIQPEPWVRAELTAISTEFPLASTIAWWNWGSSRAYSVGSLTCCIASNRSRIPVLCCGVDRSHAIAHAAGSVTRRNSARAMAESKLSSCLLYTSDAADE